LQYIDQRLQIQLELLMMSGMLLETCWAFNERWNNTFYYKVASCWLFLLTLLPLWTVRPVQSLSACTRVHFTFTFTFTFYCHNHTKDTDATSNKTQRYFLLRQVLHIIATKIKSIIPMSHKSLKKTVNAEKRLLYIDVDFVTYSFILAVFSARCFLYVSHSW